MRYLVILFFLFGCSDSKDVSIENCADDLDRKEYQSTINLLKQPYAYTKELDFFTNVINITSIKIKLYQKELDNLPSKEYFNFLKNQNKHNTSEFKKFLNLSFAIDYTIKKLDQYNEKEWSRYRATSDYYIDYERTKRRLERGVKDNNRWLADYIRRDKHLKTESGKSQFIKNKANELSVIEKKFSDFSKQKLKVKIQNKNYEKLFAQCEKIREKSPITFDNKWK